MNAEFWKGKNVLVTGHTGFKGSWLCLWLQQLGANVLGYSLPPPNSLSLFKLCQIESGMSSHYGDIRDTVNLDNVFRQGSPDVVIHMAAQSLVRASYLDPLGTYSTNIMGTANLLEAVRQSGTARAVVIVTSDKCYENREWDWGYRENEAMGGFDPYSSSKGCAELVTAAYYRSYFSGLVPTVGVATARAGNVIGGGDWAADRLVPDMVRAALGPTPARIRNPAAVRPWQHVLEPLCGYLELAEHLFRQPANFSGGWNFGPEDGDVKPVEWIANTFVKLWGQSAGWERDENYQPHEAQQLKLDCSKARTRLAWHPRLKLEQALGTIVDWHKALQIGKDMRLYTLEQIGSYEQGLHQ